MSRSKAFAPRSSAATAQQTASVVFPLPPFWVTNEITRILLHWYAVISLYGCNTLRVYTDNVKALYSVIASSTLAFASLRSHSGNPESFREFETIPPWKRWLSLAGDVVHPHESQGFRLSGPFVMRLAQGLPCSMARRIKEKEWGERSNIMLGLQLQEGAYGDVDRQ
jgi:hypothetical protein